MTTASVFQSVSRIALRIALVCLIALLLGAQWKTLLPISDRRFVSEIEVTLTPGGELVLGRVELGAPAADGHHVRIARDRDDGRWWLTNVAQHRAVDTVRRDGVRERMRRWPVEAGRVLAVRIGQAAFAFQHGEDGTALRISDRHGNAWHYDGLRLRGQNGAILAACPDETLSERWAHRFRWIWNAAVPASLKLRTSLKIGGGASCGTFLTQHDLPADAARIDWDPRAHRWVLRGSELPATQICQLPCRAPEQTLHLQALALDEIRQITLGRTTHAVELSDDSSHLLLRAAGRNAWVGDEDPPVHDALQRSIKPFELWRWAAPISAALAAGLALLATGLAAAAVRWQWPRVSGPDAILRCAGTALAILAVAFHLAGESIGIGYGLGLLSIAALSVGTFVSVRGPAAIAIAAAVALLLWGQIAHLQLGVLASDTGGLRFYRSGLGLSTVSLGLMLAHQGWLQSRFSSPLGERLALVVAVGALSLLVLQARFGSEAGVFGLQPVELAKLALVLLVAILAARAIEFERIDSTLANHAFWLAGMVAALFAALVATGLLLVRDLSPLLLMAMFATGGFLALASASRRYSVLALGMATLLGAALWWFQASGFEIAKDHGIYAERFDIWQNPALHPHTGQQFLRAIALLQASESEGLPDPWRVPAIHDDFMPSFFIAHFGTHAGFGLVALQVAMIIATLGAANRLLAALPANDAEDRRQGHFLFFALWGMAAFLAGHMIVSWGTNLGFTPIMGQPMPLLSAGGSVLIFLLTPFLVFLQRSDIPLAIDHVKRPSSEAPIHAPPRRI